MDMKKSRQQYRLKGAAKILSDQSIDDQLNKQTGQQEMVDSTTTSANFNDSVSAVNNNNNNINSNNNNNNSTNISSMPPQPQLATQANNQLLYLTGTQDSGSISNNTASSSATYSGCVHSSSISGGDRAIGNGNIATISGGNAQSSNFGQQQPFRSPPSLPCDLKSLFECPICFDYAVPPIYQCQNGHLVCQCCSTKITHCPTCRVPVAEPSIRNLQLDRLANTCQFPCKYNFNGCQWKSYWFKKREHEENCEFISYSCPCPGTTCRWTGLLSQVMSHLSEHHKSITTLNGEDIVFLATDINLKGAVDWVMIQSCFNRHFLLVLEKQELKTGQHQFFAVVQLIGSQKEAEKFKYKLELTSNVTGQVKRLQWEATPRSILDGIQAAISTYDCLVFDSRTAQHFHSPIQKDKDPNGQSTNESQGENLGINVTIDCLI